MITNPFENPLTDQQFPISQQTLLEKLAEIDAALAEGDATPDQEKRGQELVTLANAAPELLEALDELYNACGFWEDQNDPVLVKARTALAKATGGSAC
jgi:hypothetical protein